MFYCFIVSMFKSLHFDYKHELLFPCLNLCTLSMNIKDKTLKEIMTHLSNKPMNMTSLNHLDKNIPYGC